VIGTSAAILGGAALGGLAGAIPKSSNSASWTDTGARSDLEDKTYSGLHSDYDALRSFTDAGPGSQDVSSSLNSSRSLADLLGQYSQSGGLPSSGDINSANSFANNIFAPQRTALQQSFTQQETDANRLSARLGRSIDDPILQAKLRTGMMNQSAMLNSQQSAFGSDLALKLPGQRVDYASRQADVLGNLASQAFKNRAALLSAGSNLNQSQIDLRFRSGIQHGEQSGGGGVGGAITGALGGAGGMASAYSGLAGLFGAGGSGGGGGTNFGGVDLSSSNSNSNLFGVGSSGVMGSDSAAPFKNYHL
jgi:hypothetical protein